MRGGSVPRYHHILNIYLWLVYNLISRSWPQIQTGVLWAPTLALRAGLPDLWLLAFGLSGYHHDWLTLPSSLIKHIRDNHLWFKSPVPLLHRPDWDDDSASNSQDLKSWKWQLNMQKEVNESWKCQLIGSEKSSHYHIWSENWVSCWWKVIIPACKIWKGFPWRKLKIPTWRIWNFLNCRRKNKMINSSANLQDLKKIPMITWRKTFRAVDQIREESFKWENSPY